MQQGVQQDVQQGAQQGAQSGEGGSEALGASKPQAPPRRLLRLNSEFTTHKRRERDHTNEAILAEIRALASERRAAIEQREQDKNEIYKEECEKAGMIFHPFVLGAHGGFGKEAVAVWGLLKQHAAKVQRRDWRHSWSAMSFSSCWLQKLSIAVANQTAIGALRRITVCTRQRVLGGVGESGDGDYESVVLERAVM